MASIDAIVSEALDKLADEQIPTYQSNAKPDSYLTDSRTIKGTDMLAVVKPKADFSLNTDAAAYYTDETLAAIFDIDDIELREQLLSVTNVSDIYDSAMVSFTESSEFILTDHFTELGARLAEELGASAEPFYPTVTRGNYIIADAANEGTNFYDMNTGEQEPSMGFYMNAANGGIYRRNLFRSENFSAYTLLNQLPQMIGGYPDEQFAGEKLENIRYGEEERELLDIYVPTNLNPANNNGVILFIPGGSWTEGDKAEMAKQCIYYANRGYVTATMSHTYALSALKDGTSCTFYTINNEVGLAFAKIKELSDERNWNITQAAVNGYSSGCHVAFLYAYSQGNEPEAPIPVKFAFGMVGSMDFHSECWQNVSVSGPGLASLGTSDARLADTENPYPQEEFDRIIDTVSPLAFAKQGDAVPTLAAYGEVDYLLIDYLNGVYLKDALDAQNIFNEIIFYPNSDHAMGTNPGCNKLYIRRSEELLKEYFGY